MTLPTIPGVPRPLLEAAQTEARKLLNGDAAAAATLVGLLGFVGVGASTSSFVLALLGLVPGAVTYGTTLFAQAQAAYRVAYSAEQQVTPLERPRSADGIPLVPTSSVNGIPHPDADSATTSFARGSDPAVDPYAG